MSYSNFVNVLKYSHRVGPSLQETLKFKMKFVVVLLYISVVSAKMKPLEGHNQTLKDLIEENSLVGFDFPLDRPYHYFNYTKDIPENFLPIELDQLPKLKGVWIQRHKDFAGLPRVYRGADLDTSKSYIRFSPKASYFDAVTIKALAVGTAVDMHIIFPPAPGYTPSQFSEVIQDPYNPYNERRNLQLHPVGEERKPNRSLIKLLEVANCTNFVDEGYRWVEYKIYPDRIATHMAIELQIHHPDAFLMIDEISVHFSAAKRSEDKDKEVEVKEDNIQQDKIATCRTLDE